MSVHIKDADERYEIFAESSDSINATLRNIMNHPEASLKEIALVSDDEGKEIIRVSAGEALRLGCYSYWTD